MAAIKTDREIALMRVAGKILAKTFQALVPLVRPGASGVALDAHARMLIKQWGGHPAFLGYKPYGAARPFPAALCVSINDVVVHGVPTNRPFAEGDLIKLDLGVRVGGYYADAALTVPVGRVSADAERLLNATKQALERGMRAARAGNTLGDIGYAISSVAKRHRVKVVEGLTGHGIGSELHEDPAVLNEGSPHTGLTLAAGMALAIEPMFSLGSKRIVQQDDDGYTTSDRAMSAHFEHTVLITDGAPEVLTVLYYYA